MSHIYMPHYWRYHALPAPNVRCARCLNRHWARPQIILTIPGATDAGHEYAAISGGWVLCVHCIPPRLWAAFFTKFDSITPLGAIWRESEATKWQTPYKPTNPSEQNELLPKLPAA